MNRFWACIKSVTVCFEGLLGSVINYSFASALVNLLDRFGQNRDVFKYRYAPPCHNSAVALKMDTDMVRFERSASVEKQRHT